jgi:glutathione S-transferase
MMLVLHGGRRSPYVRRVAIWLALQERAFERNYIDAFSEGLGDYLSINPIGRVPALTLSADEHLIETGTIIDHLEDTSDRRFIPVTGVPRRRCLARIAVANALAEKGVALVYEVERRPPEYLWEDWRRRMVTQVNSGLAALEAMVPETGWMGGENMDGSDIAAVCAHDFLGTVAGLSPVATPRLAELAARANAIPAFSNTRPPAPVQR